MYEFMDLHEFRNQYIKQELGITDNFGRLLAFIDFGNVNYWFEEDRQTHENVALKDDEKFVIDVEKLKGFLEIFAKDIRFYYRHDSANHKSIWFIQKVESIFGKTRVFTKAIQKVRHYLENQDDKKLNTRILHHDSNGDFVFLPKCNFDVEICVDAIKIAEHYDTICLLSSDADFVYLSRFLKQKGKKVVLIKGGNIVHQLKDISDIVINAQEIKKHITCIKQKPGI
jgi:uncharacterized LabA/DUF88 family protein